MKEAPIGEWVSPLTSDLIVSKTIKLCTPSVLDSDGSVYWLEGRPSEKGRQVIVTLDSGGPRDITPKEDSGFYVRTRVHEYGGGEYLVADGVVYFSNFPDQLVYKQRLDTCEVDVQPLTSKYPKMRFADYILDQQRGRLIAVCEDHSAEEEGDPSNCLAAIDTSSGDVTVLASGADFYSSPALSPDGGQLAWVQWHHPNMPWDTTELMCAELDQDGGLAGTWQVAGGGEEAPQQPRWGPDGSLHYISDGSGWWNLYRAAGGKQRGEAVPLCPRALEFGVPMWVFGNATYHVLRDGRLLALYCGPGKPGMCLALVDPKDGSLTDIDTGLTSFGSPARLAVREQPDGGLTLVTVGGSATASPQVLRLQVATVAALLASRPADWVALKAGSDAQVAKGYLSEPQVVEFPTTSGLTSFMNYYPPANKDYTLPAGQLPALLVQIHGGPTSSARTTLNLGLQYWTSRGFAVADVNYGGSTGFGREYRNRLRGQWGVVDVNDCSNAALYLAQKGLADPQRLCISGGSAGGFTTLACLAFKKVFAAGASLYGVADLALLAEHTHKFESRYLDRLVGPWPEAKDIYTARSPLAAVDQFTAPVIFFQGDEDKVVPPEQACVMHNALRTRGLVTALVMFAGEQHGFRQATNIRRCLDGEMFFYGAALCFHADMPPELEKIAIDNLPDRVVT